jgi:AsmA protein
VGEVKLTDGTISFGNVPSKRRPILYDKVNVTVKNLSMTTAFPVTIAVELPGGGSLNIDGTLGPINSSDVSLSPLKAKLNIKKLDLAQSAMVDPALGITGSADFDGSVTSDGRIAKTNGTVKATNLKIVPKGGPAGRPIEVTYTLEHNLAAESGKLTQGDIAIGKALAKLNGTYEMHGETTSVRMKLVGQGMPVDDLETVLPAVGVTMPSGSQLKGGTLSVDFDSNGSLDKLVTTGSVKMSNSELAGFDLGAKMSAVSALTGKQTGKDLNIQNLSSDVRNSPEGTQLDKINLIVPTLGTVTGAGTINPANALNFKMNVNLTGGVAGGLTKVAGLGSSNGIPVLVGGTTSNPTFMPDVKGMATGQLKGLLGNTTGQNNPVSGVMGCDKGYGLASQH